MYISSHYRSSVIGLAVARAAINTMENKKDKFTENDLLFTAAAMIIENICIERKQRICTKAKCYKL